MRIKKNYPNLKKCDLYESKKNKEYLASIEDDFGYDLLKSVDIVFRRYLSKYKDLDIDFFDLLAIKLPAIVDIIIDDYDNYDYDNE